MRFCKQCGETLSSNTIYCKSCGLRVEDSAGNINVTENKNQFCRLCGAKVEKQYCPNCGAYGSVVQQKEGLVPNLNVKKIIGQVGMLNKAGGKGIADIQSLNPKAWLAALDWKLLLRDIGIFAAAMLVFTLVVIFGVNGIVKASIVSALKDMGVTSQNYASLLEMLNVKPYIGSLMYGFSTKMSFGIGGNTGVMASFAYKLTACVLPLTILFFFVSDQIRMRVSRTKRSLVTTIAMALANGLVTAIVIKIIQASKPSLGSGNGYQSLASNLDLGAVANMMLKTGSNFFGILFTVFMVTFFALFLLPGLEPRWKMAMVVQRMVRYTLGFFLIIGFVPAFLTVIRLKVSVFPHMNVLVLLIGFLPFLTMMFAGAIVTGSTSLFSVVAPSLGIGSLSQYSMKSGLLHMKYDYGFIKGSGLSPFWMYQLIAAVVLVLILVYIGTRIYDIFKDSRKELLVSAVSYLLLVTSVMTYLAYAASGGIHMRIQAKLLDIEQKTPVKISISGGSYQVAGYFFRCLLFMAVVGLAVFLVQKYAQPAYRIINNWRRKRVITWALTFVLLFSVVSVTSVQIDSWYPLVEGAASALGGDDLSVIEFADSMDDTLYELKQLDLQGAMGKVLEKFGDQLYQLEDGIGGSWFGDDY